MKNYLIILSTQLQISIYKEANKHLFLFLSFGVFCFSAYKELSFIIVFFKTEFGSVVSFLLIPIPHPLRPRFLSHFLIHMTLCPSFQHLPFPLMASSPSLYPHNSSFTQRPSVWGHQRRLTDQTALKQRD